MMRWLPRLGLVIAVACLVAAAWVGVRLLRLRPHEDDRVVEAEIARLTVQRDSMRSDMADAASRSDLFSRHPEGDVLIGVPTPFVRGLVRDVVKGWFYRVDLHLRNIDAHAGGDVEARLPLLGTKRVGTYQLFVHIDDIRGRIEPGLPSLDFGGGLIRVALPVDVAGGSGSAHITLDWKSKGAAKVVCGNLNTTRVVTGTIRPQKYTVNGRVKLAVENGAVVADPTFPDLEVRLFIVPSPAAIATLDSVLDQKGGLCGVAVRKARVAEKILALVDQGINVKLPQRFFRPIRLPIAVRTVVPVEQGRLSLTVQPSGLVVSREMVWLGAEVGIAARDSAQIKHIPALLSPGGRKRAK